MIKQKITKPRSTLRDRFKLAEQSKKIDNILEKLATVEKIKGSNKSAFMNMDSFQIDKKKLAPEFKQAYINKMPMVMDAMGQNVNASDVIKGYMGDSFNPMGGGLGQSTIGFESINSLLIDNWFMGWAEYSMLSQNGILGRICDCLATAMCDKWIEFVGVGENDKEEKIKELEKAFERFDVRTKMERALYLSFVFGGCMIYPKLKNDEENQERENELFIDSTKIGKDDLEYIQIIEPSWYVPIKYNTTEPFSKWFYKPEFYTVIGQITHNSRLFPIIYNEAVNLLKPIYLFNGIPLLQQCIPYVMKFESTYNEIVAIVKRYNLSVLKMDMESLINSGGSNDYQSAENVVNRATVFNTMRDNSGLLAIGNEEEFQQLQMTLTGLDVLLNQCLELVATIPGIPVTKLFGGSPKGMNATGEFEMKNFYDRVSSLQNKMIRPALIKIMNLVMLDIWGEIDEDITFKFEKLEESNKLEDSQIQMNEASTATTYASIGVLDAFDIRSKIANDPKSGYDNLELDEEKLENEFTEETTSKENIDLDKT